MSALNVLHGCATIQLPKGLNTLVDAGLYRLLNALTWGLIHRGGKFVYPIHQERRLGKLFSVKMHQFVANPANGVRVDHKNRDTLDNRRENLRFSTPSENACNATQKRRGGATSRFKGVSQRRPGDPWLARITKNRTTRSLGYFRTEREAAEAYDRAARKLHGEFALTNDAHNDG